VRVAIEDVWRSEEEGADLFARYLEFVVAPVQHLVPLQLRVVLVEPVGFGIGVGDVVFACGRRGGYCCSGELDSERGVGAVVRDQVRDPVGVAVA